MNDLPYVVDPENGYWQCETCGKVFDSEEEGNTGGGDDGSASPSCGKCFDASHEGVC